MVSRTHRFGPGFTLVELMIVVAIVGVVAAIAVPRYGAAAGRYQVDMAGRRLVAELELVSARAKSASAAHMVAFDTANDTITVYGPLPDISPPVVAVVDLGAEPYRADLYKVTLEDSGAKLIFDGFGSPTQSGGIEIVAGGTARKVVIDSDTGEVNSQ